MRYIKNILVIEDRDETYLILENTLKELAIETAQISRCSSLGEVVDYSEPVDIVLTNLALPDSPGTDLVKGVLEKFPDIPVLVLAAPEELALALKSEEQGAQDYLIKGEWNARTLGKSMQSALEHKRLANNYRRTFMESPAPMYIFENNTFRLLECNHAALHQYGYSREEFLNLTVTEILPAEDVAAFLEAGRQVPDVYSDYGSWRHIRRNGEVFYVHVFAHNTEFEGRSARTVLAINIDKQVKAERALEEKVAETENILESIADGFLAINDQWEFTYINKVFEEKLHAKRKDLLGKLIWDSFPAAKDTLFYTEYHRAMTYKVNVHFEEYYRPLNIWVSVNAYPTGNGLAVYFVDITEQKKIQEKIFNNEQNLRTIINNTADIIWSIDAQHNIITANDAFWDRVHRVTGVNKWELAPEHFEQAKLSQWNEYFDRALAGEAFKMVWEDCYDGAEVFEEVGFNPIRDAQQAVIGVSCFSRDITRQRMHLNMIEKQNRQLNEIAWIQSHELRSPVANIMGLTQLFNKKDTGDPMNREVMDKLEISVNKLDGVIRKIMEKTDELITAPVYIAAGKSQKEAGAPDLQQRAEEEE